MIRHRPSFALALAVVLSVTATACDPPPPPVIVIQADAGTGPDMNPGDRVCASSPSGGCGLDAAIDEANALTPLGADGPVAVIEVPGLPQLWYPVTTTPTVITGNVKIVDDDRYFTLVAGRTFYVAPGARLEMQVDLVTRAQGCFSPCPPIGETRFDVDGTLVLRRTSIRDGGYHYVRVNPGGVAVLDRVDLSLGYVWMDPEGNDGSQVILNRGGTVVLHRTGVHIGGARGAVTTLDGGVTYMSSSAISLPARPYSLGPAWPPWPEGTGEACGGTPPISLGGNRAADDTCQLTGPGDING